MKLRKMASAAMAAVLPFAPQVQADEFNPELVSQLYLRTGFGGAAEQVTGLRYGLQYDYSSSTNPLPQRDTLMRMEFLGVDLVSLNLGGVNVTPAVDMLRAAGFGALGNAGALFAAGGAAVAYSVAKNNEDKAGFQDLTEEEEPQSEGEEEGEEPDPCQFQSQLCNRLTSVRYIDDTLYYSRDLVPVDPAMLHYAD